MLIGKLYLKHCQERNLCTLFSSEYFNYFCCILFCPLKRNGTKYKYVFKFSHEKYIDLIVCNNRKYGNANFT